MTEAALKLHEEHQRALPSGWRWVRLGDVCEIISGQSPPGETYRKQPEGLPFFQGKADFGDRYPIPRTWCVAPVKVAKPGDILISVRAPVGPTNVTDVECCIGRGLAAIRPHSEVNRDFILAALQRYEPELATLGSGSTFAAINRDVLTNLELPLPPLPEQRRIAALLNEQLAAVERARAITGDQAGIARRLPAAYLRSAFSSSEVEQWRRARLGDVCGLLPSKSIATSGDTTILAVTTACLTETGFDPNGLKSARMWAGDAEQAKLQPGEILIARSNTADLVGRVARYDGEVDDVVASDLTIRLWPSSVIDGKYLAFYLSFLYLSGYWKERAGGASDSMKKITRTQLAAELVPLPPLSDQRRVASSLVGKLSTVDRTVRTLESQLDAVNRLPGALLRRAFTGEM